MTQFGAYKSGKGVLAGETDLANLVSAMRPSLAEAAYSFAVSRGLHVPEGINPVATFREAEGLTIIARADDIERSDLDSVGPWAMITLNVQSSLSAVGLTAVVSSALAAEGISANVVAAYFHDHIFVPWPKRKQAINILERLSKQNHVRRQPASEAAESPKEVLPDD